MKTAKLLVCLLLTIPLVGTVRKAVPVPKVMSLVSSTERNALRGELQARRKEFVSIAQSGKYQAAASLFEKGYQDASRLGENDLAARFLLGLGNCRFALHQYQEALQAFFESRRISKSAGDSGAVGLSDINISSLYWQMGELDAAVHAAELGVEDLRGKNQSRYRANLLVHLASLRAGQGRMEEAVELFREGLDEAAASSDLALYAIGWDRLGENFLEREQLPQAERAMLEAYRIRKLNRLSALSTSYWNLGRLRMAQGDLRSASVLLDEAVQLSEQPLALMPTWRIYDARGRVRLAQGRLSEALADFRVAIRLVRMWRLAAPADDIIRVSVEGALQQLYAALVETGNRLYLSGGDSDLVRETFEAAEENRSASLLLLSMPNQDFRQTLPAEYWETVAQYQAAEVELVRDNNSSARQRMWLLRARLMEMESHVDAKQAVDISHLLERTQKKLGTETALLSFNLGKSESWLWAVTRHDFKVYRLDPRADIAARVRNFSRAVSSGSSAAGSLGGELYEKLFGSLEAHFLNKARWLLALDEELFDLPLPALVVGTRKGKPVYLAERHALQVTSGALMLASSDPESQAFSGPFLGIGDAIYNQADTRWRRFSRNPIRNLLHFSGQGSKSHLDLTRLAGSGREIGACAKAWGASDSTILLQGAEASKKRLEASLLSDPSIVHFAAHVLQSEQPPKHGLIALSLSPGGETEFLSPEEIKRWRVSARLVVLSGCSSGIAQALPGTGLMGMTRAWLAAGAGAVASSRWPTPDDSGSLFISLYQHLREAREAGPAVALQRAQMDMLQSGSWRSNPQYWAAYSIFANN